MAEDAEPSDDSVQRRPHLVAERRQEQVLGPVGRFGFPPRCLFTSQQRLAVSLDLFRIAANGVSERLVHRFVEPRHVIQVAHVWGPFALTPQPEHACAKSPVFGDHRPQLETRRHPALSGDDDARVKSSPLPPLGAGAFGFFGLLCTGLGRLHVRRRSAQDVSSVVAQLRRFGRRPLRPNAARKRFPLHKNEFLVRHMKSASRTIMTITALKAPRAGDTITSASTTCGRDRPNRGNRLVRFRGRSKPPETEKREAATPPAVSEYCRAGQVTSRSTAHRPSS